MASCGAMRQALIVLLLAVITASSARPVIAVGQLGSYTIDRNEISVAGVSAGGYMAVQFHVSFSSIIKGAGVIAAGPYYCELSCSLDEPALICGRPGAQNNVELALTSCMSAPDGIDVSELQQITRNTADSMILTSKRRCTLL